jgi:hypothetical protein
LVVQEPPELRQQMGDTLRRAAAAYGDKEGKVSSV